MIPLNEQQTAFVETLDERQQALYRELHAIQLSGTDAYFKLEARVHSIEQQLTYLQSAVAATTQYQRGY